MPSDRVDKDRMPGASVGKATSDVLSGDHSNAKPSPRDAIAVGGRRPLGAHVSR